MKKIKLFLPAMTFVMASPSAFSQKYNTAADTVKLNKEYIEVTNAIANLTSKLSIAENNLPGYHNKVNEAVSKAGNSAIKSSEQASAAVDGNVGDAKKAKRKAKSALYDAKEVRDANAKVKDQEKKIANLSLELEKKQTRRQELEGMRTAIQNIQQ
jgi:uncharacterized protein DUF6520